MGGGVDPFPAGEAVVGGRLVWEMGVGMCGVLCIIDV